MTDWLKQLTALTDDYYRWLRRKTDIAPASEGWAVIATPFLGAFNDAIEIFARRENNGKILLVDDGETVRNLKLQGCDILRSKKRTEIAETIARTYGVSMRGGELRAEVARDADFPGRKHDLLSAIAEINDMVVLARPSVKQLFAEDVREFLDERGIVNTPQFMCRGASGMNFTFDFHVAGKENETVIRSFASINKQKAVQFLFSWDDIREQREKMSGKKLSGVAVINDTLPDDDLLDASSRLVPVPAGILDALQKKGADYVLWSERERDENLRKLAA